MGTHIDEDEVVLGVIQLLGEVSSDSDTSSTTAEDNDILRRRGGRHGMRRGLDVDVNIERGCYLYKVDRIEHCTVHALGRLAT